MSWRVVTVDGAHSVTFKPLILATIMKWRDVRGKHTKNDITTEGHNNDNVGSLYVYFLGGQWNLIITLYQFLP